MTQKIEFNVHVRVGSNGVTAAVTDQDIESGTTLDDTWAEDSDVTFYDARIAVTAALPVELPAVEIEAPAVTAEASA